MYNIIERDKDVLISLYQEKVKGQTIFTTYEWITYLEMDGKGKPIILEVLDGNKIVAYFVGLLFKKMGVRIIGSPFEGWGTSDMGFIIINDCDKVQLLKSIEAYAYKTFKCFYLEISDKNFTMEDLIKTDYEVIWKKTLMLDISQPEDFLFSNFKKDARNSIRQFEKRGATLEQVDPSEEFAIEHYNQLIDVFRKQNLNPPYSLSRVKNLILAFKDSPEKILCMRVTSPDNEPVATSIYLGLNKKCYSWATASYRELQHYRPNEAIRWYGIRYWKEHGFTEFDLVGFRQYKMKFSPYEYEYPRIIMTRFKILIRFRKIAKNLIQIIRKYKGKLFKTSKIQRNDVKDSE